MIRSTTVLSVRKKSSVVMISDGQVTLGHNVMKGNAKKVRKTYGDKVLAGFAGATADAFTLFDKFEAKLEEYQGNLTRSAVEMAKEWRSDKILRRLEAMLCVADAKNSFILSGNGDVIEPEDGIMAIGSGSMYALAAGKSLLENTNLSAKDIAKKAMVITANICIYTNNNFTLIEL